MKSNSDMISPRFILIDFNIVFLLNFIINSYIKFIFNLNKKLYRVIKLKSFKTD